MPERFDLIPFQIDHIIAAEETLLSSLLWV